MKLHDALTLSALLLVGCAAPIDESEDEGETTSELKAGVHVEVQSNAKSEKDKVVDRAILDRVVAMINGTPDNGKIFAAIHSIDEDVVADALIAKSKAGATVKVVMDGSKRGKPLPEKLKAALEGNFKYCGQANGGDGCISNVKDGIMHSKLFLFSKTADETGQLRNDVAWFSSANMTAQTGAKTFNNALAVYGDGELHSAMKNRYFDRLWDKANAVPDTIVANDSKTVVFASPTKKDLVAERLANVEKSADCKLTISQNMIHFKVRPEVWKQVKRINGFCTVKVLVNHIDEASFDMLKKEGIEARYSYTHDKVFLIDAKMNGRRQLVTFTGSHNWTRDASDSNDELLVRSEVPEVYAAMAGHLIQQWAKSSTLRPKM